jgi:hypothetical protein
MKCAVQISWSGMIYKFHGDQFRHLSNITAITATIWEIVTLVLLIKDLCMPFRWLHAARYIRTYRVEWRLVQAFRDIKVWHQQFEWLQCCHCWWVGIMYFDATMGLGDTIYMPSFINTGSGIQKLMGGGTERGRWFHNPAFIFFKTSGLKTGVKRDGAGIVHSV